MVIDPDQSEEVCLLLRVPGGAPLVGSNPSSPRLTTFCFADCFAEKVRVAWVRKAGRWGGG